MCNFSPTSAATEHYSLVTDQISHYESLLFQEEKKETKYNKSMIQNVLSTNFFIIYFCFSKFCFANTNQSDTIKAPPPKQNQAKQTTLCS